MTNIFNQISRQQVIAVASGIGKVGVAAIGSSAAQKVLKVAVESTVNGINNIRTTIKNR